LKFFGRSREKSDNFNKKKTVLFVCIENAGRSQIAEGFFRKYAPKKTINHLVPELHQPV